MNADKASELARRTKAVARSVLRNDADAEDVSQEALIVVVKNERSIDDPVAYGVTVAYRAAVTLANRRAKELLVDFTGVPETDRRDQDGHDEARTIVNRLFVEDLLRHLSPQQARALEGRYLMDMPVDDVAVSLGVSINTAKTHLRLGLRNALKRLRVNDDSAN